jgi:hypothetical protein
MKIKILIAFLIAVIMVVNVSTAQTMKDLSSISPDAVKLDETKDSFFIAFKDVIGEEKTPDNQVWLFDAAVLKAQMISCIGNLVGNGYSDSASISEDGTKAVFHSWSDNLGVVSPCANVFLKDMKSGGMLVVKDHALSPAISKDGRYIVYEYNADPEKGLPAIYRYDTSTGTEQFIDYTSFGNTKGGWYFPNPLISDDGLTVIYHTTKNGNPETYLWSSDLKPTFLHKGTVTGDEKI